MQIEEIKETDLDEVEALENASFSRPWSRKSLADAVKKEENLYLAAKENGELLGFCGLWGVAGEGQITHVCVKEDARRKGVGSALLAELIRLGGEKGLTSFTLEVRVGNVPAIALYEKAGFKGAGIRKGFYDAPKEDALIMWL